MSNATDNVIKGSQILSLVSPRIMLNVTKSVINGNVKSQCAMSSKIMSSIIDSVMSWYHQGYHIIMSYIICVTTFTCITAGSESNTVLYNKYWHNFFMFSQQVNENGELVCNILLLQLL